jgi:hypothetical protein
MNLIEASGVEVAAESRLYSTKFQTPAGDIH